MQISLTESQLSVITIQTTYSLKILAKINDSECGERLTKRQTEFKL